MRRESSALTSNRSFPGRSTASGISQPLNHWDHQTLLELREREYRDRHGLYYAEGLRFAFSALDANVPIAGYAWCPELLRKHSSIGLLDRLEGKNGIRLARSEFDQLKFAPEPQGIALILRQTMINLQSIRLRNAETWLGVENIRSTGNLGTILRALKAAGGAGLMVFANRGETIDVYDPQTLRASMGAAIGMKIVRTGYKELRSWAFRSEIRVLGADTEGSLDFRRVKFRRNVLLMVGDERHGLSPGQRSACDGFVRIPMASGVDSLNVAMATTVLLFEAFGQKHR